MYKIKIFSQYNHLTRLGERNLETRFNKWVEKNPEVVIMDLQYQVETGIQYLCVGYYDCGSENDGDAR